MSRIKMIDANNSIIESADALFEKILAMQTESDGQIANIKSIEKRIIDIQKQKKEEERKAAEEQAAQAEKEAEAKAAAAEPAEIKETPKPDEAAVAAEEKQPEIKAAQEAPQETEKPVAKEAPETETAETKATDAEGEKEVKREAAAEKQESAAKPERNVRNDGSPANRERQGRVFENKDRSGERPPVNRGEGRVFENIDRRGERPPVNGERGGRVFVNRDRSGDRPPMSRDGERPPMNRGEGRVFVNRDRSGDRPPMNRDRNGERPPFNKDRNGDAQRRPAMKKDAPARGEEEKTSFEKPKLNYDAKKHKKPAVDDSKTRQVKKGIKERVILSDDEYKRGPRKRTKKQLIKPVIEPIKIEKAVITGETVSVKVFSDKIGKPVSDILKKLLLLGMMCTINSQIDYDTAGLVAGEFGIELEQVFEQTAEDVLTAGDDVEDDEKDVVIRPPIVTIMGHVDHGKTSLLDKIRSSKVTESEAGGITQHIGAYQIKVNGKMITFIDTPGHEAFTAMRARGAQVTDITILVVAADDGVMPQTIEAINHAKAAGVPIIIAINKIDKAGANIERIKQNLTEYDLVPEEWGGDTIMVPVSAHTGEGIQTLLEMIILVSEVAELKANPKRLAKGTIIEAKLDKGRGPVATVLVQNGTLNISDTIVAGTAYGRVRAMLNDTGKSVAKAGPSQPVEVIGFSEVPEAGDILYAVEQDKLSKQVVEERKDKQKADMLKKMSKVSLDDLFSQIAEGQIKELDIIIRADVQGSVEAVKQSLEKLSTDEVRVKAIHCGVGAIRETDVMLASASNAIIIGFNVRPDNMASAAAEREKVDIRLYRIIYNAIEDITKAMQGMLDPEFEEAVLGHVEVRQTFKVSAVGTIAGCYVTDGKITRNSTVRLLRDNVVVHEGKISSLKRFKDDAKEVLSGYECGISLENYNDIKEGDVIEPFEMREIER